MNKNRPTVTVGIAAYNEGQNILNLLGSILEQSQKTYRLERIMIISDGSTDDMEKKVVGLQQIEKRIVLLADHKRLGKAERLKEIFRSNSSDFIFIFDGDVVLSDDRVIENMLAEFKSKRYVVVGGNNQPPPSNSTVELLINKWYEIWFEIRDEFRSGSNVHNLHSCVLALRKKFAQRLNFPDGIVSDSQYIYFSLLAENLKFCFARKAIVWFRWPNTISDYIKQKTRYKGNKTGIAKYFGEWIHDEYRIPTIFKLKIVWRKFLENPPIFIYAAAFQFSTQILAKFSKSKSGNKKIWSTAKSTKTALNMRFNK